jgi:anti-anti-sigma factor
VPYAQTHRPQPPLPEMTVRLVEHGTSIEVILAGELDFAGRPVAHEAIADAFTRRARVVVLNLSRLTFMDSTGVHLVSDARGLAAAEHVELRVIPGPPAVQRVFAAAELADRSAGPWAEPGEPAPEAMEDREVRVSDPRLSDSANERLTEELRDVVGTDHVTVPKDRAHLSRGERPAGRRLPAGGTSTNFILIIMALVLLVLGALLTALTGRWWFMAFAFIVDALGAGVMTAMVLQMIGIREHADATTVAMLEEQGIANPDEHFSRLLEEFTEVHREGAAAGERRVTAVEDDPLQAGAEQAASVTPTGGPSRPVGPGSAN